MTQNIPPVLDASGKPVQRPASALGGANPFLVSSANADPIATELARLGVSTPQPPKSVKLRGKTEQLDANESVQVGSEEGRILTQRIAKMMASSAWKRLNDDQKRQRIREVQSEITQQRPARVKKMRYERLSAAEGLGSTDVTGRSL